MTFEDVVLEIDCAVATFDGVTLCSKDANCWAGAADDATFKDNRCGPIFDDVAIGVERRMPYVVAAVVARVPADVTAGCDVLTTPFTVAGGSRLYEAN